jgi:fucose permease
MVTKTSILIFYLRLSRNTIKLLRIASYTTLALVNVAGVVLTFLNVFQCKPVGAVFDSANTTAQCIPLITLYLASAPVNIITDLAILVLPIPVLTGMRLPQKQKVILVATFGLGIFVTIVDVVRIYYLQQASADVGSALTQMGSIGDQRDFAWYASLSLMWSAVEVNIGITCACIPTLKPLITRILPKLIHDHTVHQTSDTAKSVSYVSPEETGPPNGFGSGTARANIDADADDEPPTAPITLPLPPSRAAQLTTPAHAEPAHTSPSGPADYESEMGMMDFLTTPGMDPRAIQRTQTHLTTTATLTNTNGSGGNNAVYFGFVNMHKPRSMLRTTASESLKYCALVTLLFFLWGFSYGLLNTLNSHISALANAASLPQSLGLQSAYFGAYVTGPLIIGQYVLKRGGFKACFITGLCIYGTGTLMFWPSAVLVSFPGFVVSNFFVATGLSVLETAANPFIALCGPADYAEMRLLLAQGVQAVGSVVSPLLAEKVFFKSVVASGQGGGGVASLIDVQWTYLAIALFDVVLALFFYYCPLPEASDEDLAIAARRGMRLPSLNNMVVPDAVERRHIQVFGWRWRVVFVSLALGVGSQWLYVGAQECVSVYFESLLSSFVPAAGSAGVATTVLALSTFNYSLLGRVTFALGRFFFAALCVVVKPRLLLLGCFACALLFSILVFALPATVGSWASANTVAAMALVLFFFEGPLFPLIFAISLRGLGRSTKSAAAWITAGVSGGAVLPWLFFAAMQSNNHGVRYGFCVVIASFAVCLLFPIWLCAERGAREQVDPVGKKAALRRLSDGRGHRGSEASNVRELRNGSFDSVMYEQRRPSGYGITKERPGSPLKRIAGLWGKRKNGEGGGRLPSVEHRERASLGSPLPGLGSGKSER